MISPRRAAWNIASTWSYCVPPAFFAFSSASFLALILSSISAFSLREATFAARQGSGLLASLGAPLEAAEKRYVERLLPSHDGNEGIEAFLAKRPPKWVDA